MFYMLILSTNMENGASKVNNSVDSLYQQIGKKENETVKNKCFFEVNLEKHFSILQKNFLFWIYFFRQICENITDLNWKFYALNMFTKHTSFDRLIYKVVIGFANKYAGVGLHKT